jgi:hypothetical protein
MGVGQVTRGMCGLHRRLHQLVTAQDAPGLTIESWEGGDYPLIQATKPQPACTVGRHEKAPRPSGVEQGWGPGLPTGQAPHHF